MEELKENELIKSRLDLLGDIVDIIDMKNGLYKVFINKNDNCFICDIQYMGAYLQGIINYLDL